MNINKGFLAIPFACLAGCATTQDPLIFVSTDTFGVDVTAGATSTAPLSLNLGWKENNVSLVPVTAADKNGTVTPIRGCAMSLAGSGTFTPCPTDPTALPAATAGTASRTAADASLNVPNVVRTALFAPLAIPTGAAAASDSMRDALSVYSSFNGGAGANNGGTSGVAATISLGKVFATGVAAQQLTQGQNYLLQQSGVTTCLAQLANAMGAGKVTEAALATCKK